MILRVIKCSAATWAFVAILLLMTVSAHAELNHYINLVDQGLVLQKQDDPRWGRWLIGPEDKIIPESDPLKAVSMARCGCMLTSLSTGISHMLGGAGLPYYYHPVFEGKSLGAALTFSPKYLDMYFNYGPNRSLPRSRGWGFESGGGRVCGTEIYEWAASGIVDPVRDPFGRPLFGTGVDWNTLTWGSMARDDIDEGLLRGYPTVIVRNSLAGGGHANIIVGWDNGKKKYLIFDPLWKSTSPFNGGGENVAGTGYTGSNEEDRYTNYINNITAVLPLRPVMNPSLWMMIYDDPEPIRLLMIDPRLRRTGFDPVTGDILQEKKEAHYGEFTSFVDPLGALPEAPPFMKIIVRDPEPGVYGLMVFGTGTGPFTLTIANINFDQQEDVATITGTITNGETKRYEITRQGNGSVTVGAVAAFGPQAKAGNDAFVYMNSTLPFDGRGSQQMEGTITGYAWDFGDGASGSGAQQTHAYSSVGTYTARLTVTNAAGLTDSDERTIEVVDPLLATIWETIRVSVASDGSEGNNSSWFPQVTPDGRTVVFESHSSNFDVGDHNGTADVFVKDLETGSIERMRVPSDDSYGSSSGAISADGRFVSFLATAGPAATTGLYLHDRQAGTTEFIGRTEDGPASLSADGRYIAFSSYFLPAPPDATGYTNVLVHDRLSGTNELVSMPPAGGRKPKISADGRFVTYDDNLGDVYLRDRQAGTTEVINLSTAGVPIAASHNPSISADGRYVEFEVGGRSDGYKGLPLSSVRPDVYRRDRQTGTTEQVNTGLTDTGASFTAAISPSGRSVAFLFTTAFTLDNPDEVYLRDLQANTLERMDVHSDGTPQLYGSPIWSDVSVTSDNAVVFWTSSPNLVDDDTNNSLDIFMRRRVSGTGGATTPLANLGGPYLGWATSAAVPAAIRLDGSTSVDPQSRPLTAHWDFGDGTPLLDDGLVTIHAYAKPGIYQVTLTVSAGSDTSAATHTEVEVLPALPAQDLSINACAVPGGRLTIDGAAPAANRDLIAYGWDTSTGPIQPTPVWIDLPWAPPVQVPTQLPGLAFRTSVTVPDTFTTGSYLASVVDGASAPFNIPCSVSANLPPLAVAGGPLYQTRVDAPVILNGIDSSDPEGASLTYSWDFGDETTGTGATPEHIYTYEGNFFVSLVVNDGTQDSSLMPESRSFAMVTVILCSDADKSSGVPGCEGDVVASGSTVQFHTDMASVSENAGTAIIRVDRSGDISGAVTVDYATSDGSARAGLDYATSSGTLLFDPGVATLDFSITIFDNRYTGDSQSLNLTLSQPQGGVDLGNPSTSILMILDDDGIVSLGGSGCSGCSLNSRHPDSQVWNSFWIYFLIGIGATSALIRYRGARLHGHGRGDAPIQ